MLQPDADKDYTIEVGALWPHEKGGGYSITIKRGLALSQVDGARIAAFRIDEERERERSQQREKPRADDPKDARARSDRGYGNRNGGSRGNH